MAGLAHQPYSTGGESESSSNEGEEVLVETVPPNAPHSQSASNGGFKIKPRPPTAPLFRTDPHISTNVEVSDLLESFADDLRLMYDVQTPNYVLQWPPPPTLKVFNLAMVHSHDTIRRRLPDEELVRLMQRGEIDKAAKDNTFIQLEELFKLDGRKRKIILIEGAPGAGKSTLAWHICQKWKKQELFQEFTVVIHVQLQDPNVQRVKSLAGLFPSDSEKARELLTSKRYLGQGVLFVMDGWDEYEPGLQKGSFLEQLICSPDKVHLHFSTLLITSRPIASAKLQLYASSRVEIMGFTPDEVQRYFEEVFKNPLDIQKLQDQLRERPVIEASCYLPLNAAIVAHLFMELNQALPTTLHGIFSDVICGCIHRYLKRISRKNEVVPSILSLDKLPQDVQNVFQCMCTLAYEGSMKNKVTFSDEDLCSYGVSSELDLMQVVRSFGRRDSTLSHFLHLSVQELLTALHISKLSPPEQVRVFNKLFDNPRFSAVFRFYTTFTKLQTEGIRDIVVKIAQNRNKKGQLLNLMHCLYEAQDTSLCCFVASQLNAQLHLSNYTSLNPLNCLSVGYFLSCILMNISEEFRVELYGCLLSDNCVGLLVKGLSSSVGSSSLQDPPPGRLALSLKCNSISGVGVRYLSDMIRQSSVISELDLSGNKIQEGEDGLKHLLLALRTNASVTKYLCKCDMKYDKDSCQLMEDMLKENTSLRYMDLSSYYGHVPDELLVALGDGLKENRGLETLVLHGGGEEESWHRLLQCLTKNACLTTVVISCEADFCEVKETVNNMRHQKGLPLLEIYTFGQEISTRSRGYCEEGGRGGRWDSGSGSGKQLLSQRPVIFHSMIHNSVPATLMATMTSLRYAFPHVIPLLYTGMRSPMIHAASARPVDHHYINPSAPASISLQQVSLRRRKHPPPQHVLTESDIPELQRLLIGVAYLSFNIGIQLGVPVGVVQALQRNSPSDTFQFLGLVLFEWLRQKDPPPTLEKLTEVLSGPLINNKPVADSVRDHFGS